jgi:hypothetical protein
VPNSAGRVPTSCGTRANLSNAFLTNADLTDASLTRANLTGANLTDANLTDAIVASADFKGAWLTVGALSPEQLQTVSNGDKIIWISAMEDSDSPPQTRDDQIPEPL